MRSIDEEFNFGDLPAVISFFQEKQQYLSAFITKDDAILLPLWEPDPNIIQGLGSAGKQVAEDIRSLRIPAVDIRAGFRTSRPNMLLHKLGEEHQDDRQSCIDNILLPADK
jgi:hypothetical protein